VKLPSPYKLARLFAIVSVLSIIILGVSIGLSAYLEPPNPAEETAGGEQDQGSDLPIVISLGTLIVSMVGTTSTVLLGWRSDHRDAKEFKFKIEQLEVQLAEARTHLAAITKGSQ
jgi:hypothetical protein